MSLSRCSGVLLHPTCLPGRFGIGDLGSNAVEFLDFLAAAGQRLWQVLPLGPTGYGDSPYQCLSAFAGNPLLISLDRLIDQGLLTPAEAAHPDDPSDASDATGSLFAAGDIDFPAVIAHRRALWPRVLDRFDAAAPVALHDQFDRFCRTHAAWLADFALYMAVKAAHGHSAWTEWEPDIAQRDPAALARWSARCARDIRLHELTQFLFFEQWQRLREACRARGIVIMGDLPIFVAHDSADVWAGRELFQLDADGRPRVVAGVPPDYFSATGSSGATRTTTGTCSSGPDTPGGSSASARCLPRSTAFASTTSADSKHRGRFLRDATTAVNGRWVKGPGAALFARSKPRCRRTACRLSPRISA